MIAKKNRQIELGQKNMADSGDLEKKLMVLKKDLLKVEAIIRHLAESGDFFGGVTRLHIAAKKGYLSVCEAILKYAKDKNPRDPFGCTPLHLAAQGGHLSVCEAILEYAEDKNPRDPFGWTPLHLAAQGGHLSICKLLMRYAKDKQPIDSDGITPLDVAAECGHRQIICFILSELD